jgi:hypothetical protein
VQPPLPLYATGIMSSGLTEEEALRQAFDDSASQPVQPSPPPPPYNPWAAPPPPPAWAAPPPPPEWATPPPPPTLWFIFYFPVFYYVPDDRRRRGRYVAHLHHHDRRWRVGACVLMFYILFSCLLLCKLCFYVEKPQNRKICVVPRCNRTRGRFRPF